MAVPIKLRFKTLYFIIKSSLSLSVIAVFLAVSCPGPTPPPPDPEPYEPTKSTERSAFEKATEIGLYIKGRAVLQYDSSSFQQSCNISRKSFRIQCDNQSKYIHIDYTGNLPKAIEDETVCKVTYRLAEAEETILIVKFVVLAVKDNKIWLWNELQTTGIIVKVL